MKKIICLGVLSLLLTLVVSIISSSVHAAEDGGALENDGFVSLFNGTNWNGWHLKIRSGDAELAGRVYAIEDGMVHVFKDFPDHYELNTGSNTTHGLFYTDKKYSKFIFKFDYKWGKKTFNNFDQFQYDAGCYYHVVDDKIWPKGIEYQVRFDHLKNKNHTGDFWAGGLEWYSGTNNRFLLPQDDGKVTLGHGGEHLALPTEKYHALTDSLVAVNVSALIPAATPAGHYAVYLNLPDPAGSLHDRPEYSIRLANKDVWEDATGYNSLFHQVTISPAQ